ncbi:DUF5017 domain-containing protein [Pedobacter glucosidilyticus]|uniref:DUF5017 domain-containing protein n=1 Tax=Pedobacter glucosidilyticus TaxID=1122941 RepID=UPI0003F865DA|nr:DUF5017 domain-containing protein [Pedobacter glucosidilyticus]
MKKIIYICILGFFLAGCSKDPQVEVPTFDVQLKEEAIANVPVKFTLSGKSNVISFYSGEVLNDYKFLLGRTVEKGDLRVSFNTNVNFGTQQNQFSVLASTDFNGNYTVADVNAATWIDITSRYTLATNATFLPTSADLSDLAVDGKLIYIAFKYTTLPQTVNGAGRSWSVQNFVANSRTSIGDLQLADYRGAGFRLVQDATIIDPSRSSISTSTILLRANNSTAGRELTTYFWAISKGFDVSSKNLGPDLSIPVKGYVDPTPEVFSYTYTTPGTYTATFVAGNSTIYGEQKIVKSIEVVVK